MRERKVFDTKADRDLVVDDSIDDGNNDAKRDDLCFLHLHVYNAH